MQAASDGRVGPALYFDLIVETCTSADAAQRNCIVTGGLLEGLDEAPSIWALTRRWQAIVEDLRCRDPARR